MEILGKNLSFSGESVETKVNRRGGKEVIINRERPTVLIGERINPTGRKDLATALKNGDMEFVKKEAIDQVRAGADMLDVNVSMTDVDEVSLLPKVIQVVMDAVDVPLCIDSSNPEALKTALEVYDGKPLISSVTDEKKSLNSILPPVKEHGAAVIGLTMDEGAIPNDPDKRASIAKKIVERAESLGIPREDVIIDCLTLTVGTDIRSGLITIEAIQKVKEELGVNLTLGVSNISFGMPDRNLINSVFLAMAIFSGVACPIVNVAKARPIVLATDLLMGRDRLAMRYIEDYRKR
jgi:5-methyltetrahydrofolate--homocysteine methyltransferase